MHALWWSDRPLPGMGRPQTLSTGMEWQWLIRMTGVTRCTTRKGGTSWAACTAVWSLATLEIIGARPRTRWNRSRRIKLGAWAPSRGDMPMPNLLRASNRGVRARRPTEDVVEITNWEE